jgi:hypothetical protein
MPEKNFLIRALRLIDIDDNTNVPTTLYYPLGVGAPPLIGSAASAAAKDAHDLLNEDFKVDLGNISPTSRTIREKFPTASGISKSAVGLTSDFFNQILREVDRWLQLHGVEENVALLLAEPLSMGGELASDEWLSNYRRNIDRILKGRPGLAAVDFLPEPFAVFQYYRHGSRHPLLTDRTKYNALVIDFGGGTFDVCIVETTKEGDISRSNRNSKPLAASSEPVGGFYINRTLSEDLFRKHLSATPGRRDARLETAIDMYKRWRRDPDFQFGALNNDYQCFIKHFNRVVHEVEHLKIGLCAQIWDWQMETTLAFAGALALPKNPYTAESDVINVKVTAAEFRQLFEAKIWNSHLRPVIRRALSRGRQELGGAPLSVVLLSGGSANIGWLRTLLERDFGDDLRDAPVLIETDYQEVVAKGLAVECARRFFSEGDFGTVTYNRVCLVLEPDNRGREIKPYAPREGALPDVARMPGVLLPSASVLKAFVDQPMRWRVKLDHAPRRRLDYHFLRSSLDPDDVQQLQNPGQTVLVTPTDAKFGAALTVELSVREDGTASPRFIYREGNGSDEFAAAGKPFFLDMTYGKSKTGPGAYVGFDFGTSNSALCFVDAKSIEVYSRRASETSWSELSDLVGVLPYPLAVPLEGYLSCADPRRLVDRAREFTEAALAMGAYVALLEHCATKGAKESKLFKGFTQRSAGPLWALLRDALRQLGSKAAVTAPFRELIAGDLYPIINDFVTFLGQQKHQKASETDLDHLHPVRILANVSHLVFGRNRFGFFEEVRKRRLAKGYEGRFRHACGPSRFIDLYRYQGEESFSEDQAFLVNSDDSIAIPLEPLILWHDCPKHPDAEFGHCYIFDLIDKGKASYKAVGHACVLEVTDINSDFSELFDYLTSFSVSDQSIDLVTINKLEPWTRG